MMNRHSLPTRERLLLGIRASTKSPTESAHLFRGFAVATHVNRKERICFEDDYDKCNVYIKQALDPAYGCYVWPSALVMADYVWHSRSQFEGRTVLEVGSGTSLPSLVLAKTANPPQLVLTDTANILPIVRECLELNGIRKETTAMVCELRWGELDSITNMLAKVSATWPTRHIDYILGSDTFYDPKDFESLLMTVSYILRAHNPNCKFITAYQERSAKRSIQHLLDKWGLVCRSIPREDFEFDDTRYLDGDIKTSEIKINPGILSSVFLLEISLM